MLNSRDISLLRADVADNVRVWKAMCLARGLNVLIVNTVRDDEYQRYLAANGYAAKTATRPTFHSVKAGLAFDFCRNIKGHEYDDAVFFREAAQIGKAIGFSWGGDWRSFPDKPHLQWDAGGKWTSSMILAGKLPPTMPRYEMEDNMTGEQIYKELNEYLAKQPLPAWAKAEIEEAKRAGLTDGTNLCQLIPRYQAVILANRARKK